MRENKCWAFKDSTLKVEAAHGLFTARCGRHVSSSYVGRMPAQQRDILKGCSDSEGSVKVLKAVTEDSSRRC